MISKEISLIVASHKAHFELLDYIDELNDGRDSELRQLDPRTLQEKTRFFDGRIAIIGFMLFEVESDGEIFFDPQEYDKDSDQRVIAAPDIGRLSVLRRGTLVKSYAISVDGEYPIDMANPGIIARQGEYMKDTHPDSGVVALHSADAETRARVNRITNLDLALKLEKSLETFTEIATSTGMPVNFGAAS